MTEFVWSETRTEAVRKFGGEFPSAKLEQAVIEHFERSPAAVTSELDRVAEAKRAGRIQSGWAVWRARLNQGGTLPSPTVSDASERERAVVVADQWMRAAGCQFDRESEIVDELFGHTGRLRRWAQAEWLEDDQQHRTGEWRVAGDQGLVDEMLALWRLERPKGQLVEAESERRAAEQVLLRKRLEAAKREQPTTEEVSV